jgi:hypothetical protein
MDERIIAKPVANEISGQRPMGEWFAPTALGWIRIAQMRLIPVTSLARYWKRTGGIATL